MDSIMQVDIRTWIYAFAAIYLAVEVVFCIAFFAYMIPRANRILEPLPYRDYNRERCRLLLRILKRIEESCEITKKDVKKTIVRFLSEWFHVTRNPSLGPEASSEFPGLSPSQSMSPESSDYDDDDDDEISSDETICLYKEDIDEFFAWAFFGKAHSSLLRWESVELRRIYKELKKRHNLTFPSSKPTEREIRYHRKPRCMTLEPLNALYRPLVVYLMVYGMKILGAIFLYSQGFSRCVSKSGLVAWHRPAANPSNSFLPLLFFHGIAPGGFTLYLPMILYGLAIEKDRPVFLFENRAISCAIDFSPLTEQQTVEGVIEILERFDSLQSELSLVGHSFGSCTVTWLLASKRLPNLKQVVLLDPVSILLSEPDVMVNFLYTREMDKIRMVASSELFIEYYLRRHFAWYNSELWLEDINCEFLVCLAETDKIINARKVKEEIQRHSSNDDFIFWENVGHGDCIASPEKWKQIKEKMLEQELKIVKNR